MTSPWSGEINIDTFRFAVTADMRMYSGAGRYDKPQFFRGACQAIADRGAEPS